MSRKTGNENPGRDEALRVSSHRVVLALLLGALGIAVVLGALEMWRPSFSMEDLPVSCVFRRVTGVPCPGCGLTRSWVALARGAVSESLAFHRLGWVVMLYVGLQAFRHALWLLCGRCRRPVDRMGWWLDRGLVVLAAVLFINWAFVLAAR